MRRLRLDPHTPEAVLRVLWSFRNQHTHTHVYALMYISASSFDTLERGFLDNGQREVWGPRKSRTNMTRFASMSHAGGAGLRPDPRFEITFGRTHQNSVETQAMCVDVWPRCPSPPGSKLAWTSTPKFEETCWRIWPNLARTRPSPGRIGRAWGELDQLRPEFDAARAIPTSVAPNPAKCSRRCRSR